MSEQDIKNKNLVLSIKANQLISSYNEEFKKKKNFNYKF